VKKDSVILELHRATHATLQLLGTDLVDLDLTASEINALGNLSDGKGRTVSKLGGDVGSRPATLTGILDRLERRGLITRTTRAGDRRSVVIELTAEGERVAALVRKALRAIERRALAGLPAGSVDTARVVLRALSEAGR
jgi:DNA-binding MarR family transcriptional regulator